MEQTLISPPKKSLGRWISGALYKRIRHKILLARWKQNSFPNSFDWDWGQTNFNRIALVNLLNADRLNGDYLEIGCQGNNLFDSVPATNKVGVDPVAGGTVRKTSDDFFRENQQKFDVIFIDGLHTYEQAR
jgi:hypothetical protein